MLKFWIDFVLVLAFPCEKGSMKKLFFPFKLYSVYIFTEFSYLLPVVLPFLPPF